MIIERAQLAAALPHYEIGDPIGRGAHGLVFAARHRRLGAARAVKALVVADADEPGSSRRFRTEARVMTALDHPHLVRVLEYAEDDSIWLLVMEYLGGGTLTERMRRRVSPEQGCAWMLAVADALSVAHARGVVHRDIKPANILFSSDGLLKVGDFGIAKLFAGSDASASVDIVGTPRYVAPEQITGGRIGPPTDIYALGITLYELLSGRSPFPSQLTLPGLLHHHMSVAPNALEGAPPRLAELTMQSLAKDPADRPATAREFAVSLVAAADQDLGRDWVERSGVPLRIDSALLKRVVRPPDVTTVEFPLAASSPPGSGPGSGAQPSSGPQPGSRAQPVPGPQPGRGGRNQGRGERHTHLVGLGDPMVPPAWSPPPMALPSAESALGSAAPDSEASLAEELLAGRESGSSSAARPPSGERPSSAGARSSAEDWSAGKLPSAQPEPGARSRRWRWAVIIGAAVLTLLVVVGVAVVGLSRSSAPVAVTSSPAAASPPVSPSVPVKTPTRATLVGSFKTSDGLNVQDLAFSPDGTKLAWVNTNGLARIWTPSSGRQLGPLAAGQGNYLWAVAFNSDGTRLASGGNDGKVRRWNASTGDQVGPAHQGHVGDVLAVAFSHDDATLASGGGDKTVRLWDAQTGTPQGSALTGHTNNVDAVAFNATGDRLASAGDEGARLWDPKTRRLIRALPDSASVYELRFSPDGTVLAGVSNTGPVRLWDAQTGAPIGAAITPGQDGNGVTVGFTGDSSLVVTCAGNTIRWWDASTGRPVGAALTVHTSDTLSTLAFDRDGTELALASSDGTVRLWKLA